MRRKRPGLRRLSSELPWTGGRCQRAVWRRESGEKEGSQDWLWGDLHHRLPNLPEPQPLSTSLLPPSSLLLYLSLLHNKQQCTEASLSAQTEISTSPPCPAKQGSSTPKLSFLTSTCSSVRLGAPRSVGRGHFKDAALSGAPRLIRQRSSSIFMA